MDDYIFLLIAIALSIFGAVKKSRKKTEGNNSFDLKAEKPRNFFMDQLLGEDFLEGSAKEIKPIPMVKPILKKEPLVSSPLLVPSGQFHPGFKSTLPDRSKKNLQPSIRKTGIEELDESGEADDFSGYLDDFSLRKAFVYSEIMSRKY